MAINSSVYGTAEQWQNTAFYDKFYHNKKANFGDNTSKLSDGVTKGKLSYDEPIDKSLSYCGLGTESAMSHINYIAYANGAMSIIDKTDRFQTNFAFFEITTQTGTDGNDPYFELNDMKYRHAWQANTDTDTWWSYNKNKILEPYTLIHPKSVVFLIKIIAFNTANTQSINVTLNEYITTYTTTYPRIVQVYIVPYMNDSSALENSPSRTQYGAGGNITTNYRMCFAIGILDEYNIPTKNFDMYSYQLQATRVIMGNVNRYQTQEFASSIAICYLPENVGEHFKYERVNIVGTNYIQTYIEYYDGIIDEIIKTAACFGLYFTDKLSVAQRGLFTDNDMYIGLLDENGIGHGEYLRGAATATAPQNNYTDMSQSGYDYTKDVDKSKYSNGTSFNLWDFSLNCVNKFYVLTTAQVEQLSTELYTIMSSVSSDMPIERYNQTVFLTQNPIDCIVSIKRFPVDVPHLGTTTTVKLGSQSTSISAHYISKPCNVYYFTFSNSNDTGLYKTNGGSFLDYEPYTKVSINVPFCGSFDVPCNYFHKYGGVTVALLIDFVSGACTAFLMVNGNVVDSIQGECGVNVPLSGLQTATIDSQIFNAAMSKQKQDNNFALSMLGGAAAIGLGIATGGAAAVLGGAAAMVGGVLNKDINDKSIDYQLEHMQAPIKQVSSASPVIGRANDMRCKMIISRPEYADGYNETVYANTVGFACLINTTVNSLSGLTVGDINLDGLDASDVEKQIIKNAFASGVIL